MVTVDHYNQLIELWADYDKDATGWIAPKDLIFLIYELEQPLGKKHEYQAIKEKIADAKNHNYNPNDRHQRYIVNKEKNMILPYKIVQRELTEFSFPLY